MTDESLLAATFAALDAAVVECGRLRGERDRARDLAAALMDEDRRRGFDFDGWMRVHNRDACQGRGCAIHHPSGHHMRDWPTFWRDDRMVLERVCPHGVGHMDPDDAAYRATRGDTDTTHGCCAERCCLEGGNRE